MPVVEVAIVNAFIDGEHGGNAAGIVLDADRYTAAQKQAIAARVGLSETAFVSPSDIAAIKLEFFTPVRQIAHCGHATIATFAYLRQLGRITGETSSKETIDGTREIFYIDGLPFMEQRAPSYTNLDVHEAGVRIPDVLDALRIDGDALMPGHEPVLVGTGVGTLMVPLRDEATVAALDPDQAAIAEISERLDVVMFYAFSTQTRRPGRDAGARMFAPRYGIDEESATGMGAGPAACWLYDVMRAGHTEIAIEQGHLMRPASPSLLVARLDVREGAIVSLRVGGRAALAEVRTVEFD